MIRQKIVFIVGPTGVGKTDIACLLAQKMKGEIISCDAMQVYKEISIVSNKPSQDILKVVKHHLIGIVSIRNEFDVAAFRKKAICCIRAIHRKGRIPIIVGGSGLYMTILLDGIFEDVVKDDRLRARLEKECLQKGSRVLFERLKGVDPVAAAKIHPNDSRRVIRALEVFLLNKKPISQLQKIRQGIWGQYDISILALDRDRQELYDLIDQRVEEMFKNGVVWEIEKTLKKKWSKTATGAIGYREIKDYLSGTHDLERAKYLMKLNTRHYAKRQLTWFHRDKRISWINITKQMTPVHVVKEIIFRMETECPNA